MASSLKNVLVIYVYDSATYSTDSSDPHNAARNLAKQLDVSIASIPEIPKVNEYFGLTSPFDQKRYICLGHLKAPEGFEAVLITQKRKA